LVDRIRAGDTAALARAISLVDAGGAKAAQIHRRIHPLAGRALVVGFTGPPGVGKSTLIDAYIAELRKSGRTVAVAAVDPSSPMSGGAVLGDRVRMGRHSTDTGVFIRSLAARGHLGGLSPDIHRIIDLMDAAGYEQIIVETVGTGQSEIEVVEIADVRVVVNAPGLGDDVQALKAGILEIADILVVNKADLPLADRAVRQLENMIRLRKDGGRTVSIVATIATTGEGIERLAAHIDELGRTGRRHAGRGRSRMIRLIAQAAAKRVRDRLVAAGAPIEALASDALSGRIDIEAAAAMALAWLEEKPQGDRLKGPAGA